MILFNKSHDNKYFIMAGLEYLLKMFFIQEYLNHFVKMKWRRRKYSKITLAAVVIETRY